MRRLVVPLQVSDPPRDLLAVCSDMPCLIRRSRRSGFACQAGVRRLGPPRRALRPVRTLHCGSSLRVVALTLVCAAALLTTVGASAQQPPVAWQQWRHQVGVVDLGARGDGTLVAMIAGHFFGVSTITGAAAPLATTFTADPNAEPYFVVTPAIDRGASRCGWSADDIYVLDLTSPPGLAHIDASGQSTRFATLNGVDTLGGIAVDTAGSFDHEILVTGTHDQNQTTVFAVDCDGNVSVVTSSAPLVEGGLGVAPSTFGQYAGDLIASDENSGQVWAIDATGSAFLVIVPPLATGGDTGLESEAFVPTGFIQSLGAVYLADRGTPNNPFPGTDSILRLTASTLASAGVQDGDLLDAAEGNGTTVVIRCADTCAVVTTIQGTPGGHIEGHIAVAFPP